MKILKRFFIGLGIFAVLLISVYFLFPGFVIDAAARAARYSAGLERHEITAGKHNWVYLDNGRKGEIVVFIHGFGLSKDMWGEMLPAFTKSYRVIAPDLPAFGETKPVSDAAYTVSAEAEYFNEFVENLKLDSFHLVGVSMGGGISALYASKHPGKVKSLTLIGPFGVLPAVKSDFQQAVDKGENPLIFKTPEGYDLCMSYVILRPQKFPEHLKSYIADENSARYDFYRLGFDKMLKVEGWDFIRNKLKNIKSPALLIFGEKDRIFDVSSIDIFTREIKNSKPYIMKDTGHVTYMDNPVETNRVVSEFLAANISK